MTDLIFANFKMLPFLSRAKCGHYIDREAFTHQEKYHIMDIDSLYPCYDCAIKTLLNHATTNN